MNKDQFISELGKLRPSSTFLSLQEYCNEQQEIANFNIIFHISYKNALQKSVLILDSYIPENDLEAQAKNELINSYTNSLNKIEATPIAEMDDGYTRFFDDAGKHIKGVKMHSETQELHLYGLVVNKTLIKEGKYRTRNKQELTVAKDKLRTLCPVNKFRQFKIKPEQVRAIKVENISLLPPTY